MVEISSPGFVDKKIDAVLEAGEEKRLPTITLSVAATQVCDFRPVVSFTQVTSGRLRLVGIVSIGEKDPAAGATLALYDLQKNRRVGSTIARPDGRFLFTGLLPGLYELRIRLPGFVEMIVEKVEIRAGFESETIEFRLTSCGKPGGCPAMTWASTLLCL